MTKHVIDESETKYIFCLTNWDALLHRAQNLDPVLPDHFATSQASWSLDPDLTWLFILRSGSHRTGFGVHVECPIAHCS